MMRLQMVAARPIVWLFGDEAANDIRDSLKAFGGVDIDIRCYAYTGATLESVMDAQLLMAIGSGTLPSAIIVAAGAYDALFIAMGGGDTDIASAQFDTRVKRLKTALRLRAMENIPLLVHSSLVSKTLCTRLGIPLDWAEQVRTHGCAEPAATGIFETLLIGLGFGKDAGHESS
ncbi:MAG: hypothetical protein RL169_1971 [Armatimonadota bacterium]|jgi:hypothetical protein